MLQKITGNKMILGAVVGIVGGLIVAVLLVVVVGVGRSPSTTAEAALKPGEKAPTAATKAPAKAAASAGGHGEDSKSGLNYVIKDRIVNLADPGGRRYLRFSVAIEFAPHEDTKAALPIAPEGDGGFQLVAYVPDDDATYRPVTSGGTDPDKAFQLQIKKYVPAIEDAVTSVLSSKTYDEIRSLEGKELVKREIKDRVQRVLGDAEHVTNVYFTDFVVQ